jgi:hypothetical protein
LRGANHSLGGVAAASVDGDAADEADGADGVALAASVGASHSGGRSGGVPVRGPDSITPSTGEPEGSARRRREAGWSPDSSFSGLRTTTSGIGRDPGMLILMRVVSVVSVRGSSW